MGRTYPNPQQIQQLRHPTVCELDYFGENPRLLLSLPLLHLFCSYFLLPSISELYTIVPLYFTIGISKSSLE